MFRYRFFFSPKLIVLGVLGFCLISVYTVFGQNTNGDPDQQEYNVFLPLVLNPTQVNQQSGFPIAEASLDASLLSEKSVYTSSEGILLRFTLTNTSASTLYILRWGTPFDGFKKDMFVVTNEGNQIPYVGMLVKRGTPQPADYLALEPGAQRSVVIDISDGYAVQYGGNYNVEFVSQLVDVRHTAVSARIQEPYSSFRLMTLATQFALQGERVGDWLRRIESTAVFTNCSNNEQQSVTSALAASQTMASSARSAFQNATPTTAARYITWFGPYNNSRYSLVQTHFTKIRDALTNQNFDWDCHGAVCDPTDFAYVYPNSPYKIYLCNSFWNAALTGTDSRAGTIIHETSHFYAVASTDDRFPYGHDNSLTNAQTSPALAIDNADNYEYFAENVESLPMTAVTNPVRVRFSHTSTEIGTEDLPYNTMEEGVAAVTNNGVLQVEAGSKSGGITISKPMTIQALNGTVTLGQ